jgi:hypothetical protein
VTVAPDASVTAILEGTRPAIRSNIRTSERPTSAASLPPILDTTLLPGPRTDGLIVDTFSLSTMICGHL